NAEPRVPEVADQTVAIPFRGAKTYLAVATGTIGIALPVLDRGRMEVQRAAAKPGDVVEGADCLPVVQVLQDVITNHEIEIAARLVRRKRALDPAESSAKMLAHLQAHVLGARKGLDERLAHPPEPTTGVENTSHLELQMFDDCSDGPRASLHFRLRRDASARALVETPVELRSELVGHRQGAWGVWPGQEHETNEGRILVGQPSSS